MCCWLFFFFWRTARKFISDHESGITLCLIYHQTRAMQIACFIHTIYSDVLTQIVTFGHRGLISRGSFADKVIVRSLHTCKGANWTITTISQWFRRDRVFLLWSFWRAGYELLVTEWNRPSCSPAGEWCRLLPGCERALCGPSFFTSYQNVHRLGTCHLCCHLLIVDITNWPFFSLLFLVVRMCECVCVSVCRASVEVYSICSCEELFL